MLALNVSANHSYAQGFVPNVTYHIYIMLISHQDVEGTVVLL